MHHALPEGGGHVLEPAAGVHARSADHTGQPTGARPRYAPPPRRQAVARSTVRCSTSSGGGCTSSTIGRALSPRSRVTTARPSPDEPPVTRIERPSSAGDVEHACLYPAGVDFMHGGQPVPVHDERSEHQRADRSRAEALERIAGTVDHRPPGGVEAGVDQDRDAGAPLERPSNCASSGSSRGRRSVPAVPSMCTAAAMRSRHSGRTRWTNSM